jgi:diguanylate cyclase (GGDEF)-like protein/PAS domain S-box-containing protein
VSESEEKLKTYLGNAPDGVYTSDLKGTFLYGNHQSEVITGYTREQLIGKSFLKLNLLPKKYLAKAAKLLTFSVLKRPTGPDEFELIRKDGNLIWVEISTTPVKEGGKTVVIGFVRDINKRKNVEEALAQATERESAIAKLASKLVSSTSIEDISDLVLESAERFTNSTFGFVGYIDPETGYMISPTMTRGIWKSCQIKDKTVIFEKFGGLWGWVLNNRQSLLTNAPADDPRSTGTPPGHIPIRNFLSAPSLIAKELVGLVALANSSRSYNKQDLAFIERLAALYAVALQRKRLEDTVNQLAYHDPLTGLPNRMLFKDRFTLALARANRYRQKIVLMVLDMDRFKDINDTLGHDAGDQLLKDFGSRLVSILRKTDTVSRMGGDEFVLLLPEAIDAENVANVAQKILGAASKPFILHDREVRITASIGIAIYPEDGEDIETLLKHADIAMYQAKEMGRNNYQRYARIMSTVTQE